MALRVHLESISQSTVLSASRPFATSLATRRYWCGLSPPQTYQSSNIRAGTEVELGRMRRESYVPEVRQEQKQRGGMFDVTQCSRNY